MVQFIVTQLGTQYELKDQYGVYVKPAPEKDGSFGIYLFRYSDDKEIILAKYKDNLMCSNVHEKLIKLLNSTELDKLTVKMPADYNKAVDKWIENAKEYIFDRELTIIA